MAPPTQYFNLQLNDIIEEAFERCLISLQTVGSYGLTSAMRSIRLIFSEWSQLSTLPWQVVTYNEPTFVGNSLTVQDDCVDVLSVQVQDSNGFIYIMEPMTRQEYFSITDKNTNGMPTSWAFNIQNRKLYIYPGVDSNYTINYTYIQRLFDYEYTGQDLNINYAFQEALTAALAAKLGAKLKSVDSQRLVYLETKAKVALDTAIMNMNPVGTVYIGPC